MNNEQSNKYNAQRERLDFTEEGELPSLTSDIFKAAYRFLRSKGCGKEDAEDIAISALHKCIAKCKNCSLVDMSRLSIKIAHDEWVDWIRRRANAIKTSEEEFELLVETQSPNLNYRPVENQLIEIQSNEEHRKIFNKHLKTLQPRDQGMIALHLEEYSDEQIVETMRLDITPKTVANRRGEIIKQLKRLIRLKEN